VAGLVDSFQRVMLMAMPPDAEVLWPGLAVTLVALGPSYLLFKRAEAHFADVI
jgi:lipopolysaccharide transport system permease protein